MSWQVDVPVATAATETTTPEVRALVLEVMGTEHSDVINIHLGLKDEGGNWRVGVLLQPVKIQDAPGNRDMVLAEAATHMAALILTAAIDGANPLAQKYGVPDGTPLGEAAARIAWEILNPPAEEGTSEREAALEAMN